MILLGFYFATAFISTSPNIKYTPEVIATTSQAEVCSVVNGLTYSKRHRLSQTSKIKKQIFNEYDIPYSLHAKYEDDHYLPLAIGGSDSIKNRWPEAYAGTWGAKTKDRLERLAWYRVCRSHTLSLKQAQSWFYHKDWRIAYCHVYQNFKPCIAFRSVHSGKQS